MKLINLPTLKHDDGEHLAVAEITKMWKSAEKYVLCNVYLFFSLSYFIYHRMIDSAEEGKMLDVAITFLKQMKSTLRKLPKLKPRKY